jgi:phosphoribosylanthranilate isomerase
MGAAEKLPPLALSTQVKICGITRVSDGLLASELGAYAIGLNFCRESPRYAQLNDARKICSALQPYLAVVGVFVNPEASYVYNVLRELPLSLVQFHGRETPEFCAQFGVPYVKAVRVGSDVDLLQYAAWYSPARALLLDAFVAGRHGGTGHSFDWKLIPRDMPLPIILSGGLNEANVKAAIRQVRPWAVDVASGVESSPGIKDAAKMAAFIREVEDADIRPA